MNDQTERMLQQMADQNARAKQHAEARPEVVSKAVRETHNSGATMARLVKGFNDSINAQSAGLELRLDGPKQRQEGGYYLLRLIGGKSGMSGTVALICIPHFSADYFDQVRIEVQKWQSHFTLDALDHGLGGYVPGEQPQRVGSSNKYRLVQIDNTYGWIPENGKDADAVGFDELFDALIHQVLTANVPS